MFPLQTVPLFTTTVGIGFTETVFTTVVPMHPDELVPVTEYVAVALGVITTLLLVAPVDHENKLAVADAADVKYRTITTPEPPFMPTHAVTLPPPAPFPVFAAPFCPAVEPPSAAAP